MKPTCFCLGLVLGTTLLASSASTAPWNPPHLEITEVHVDLAVQQVVITGQHFDTGGTPTVLLGDDPTPLTLISHTGSKIRVELPADRPDGDYLLAVSTGPSPLHGDTYDLTIGAVDPQRDPVALNATVGVVADSPFADCIVGDVIRCEEKTTLLVSVPYGTMVEVENTITYVVYIIGEWVTLEEVVKLKLENPDPPGPGGRRIHAEVSVGGGLLAVVELRPDQPVVKDERGLNLRMGLVSDSLVSIVMDDGVVKSILTDVDGDISASVLPYAADAQQAQIEVHVVNDGDITAIYLVTVSECSGDIAQAVPFRYVTLLPGPDAEMVPFDLRTDTAFAAGETCVVRLQAPTGRTFREILVEFPGPS